MIKNKIIFSVLLCLLFGVGGGVFAQKTRQQLEKEKAENMAKLNELNGILRETTSEKKVSLGQLKAIKQQITAQNRKIELINDDLSLMNNELGDLEEAKLALDKDLGELKKEYAKTVYMASKRNNSLTELSFLFSAPSFHQLMIRYKYLKQYTAERKKQVVEMEKVQAMIATKTTNISNKKKDQQNALNTRLAESENLEKLKGKQNEVVKELSSKESELRAELAEIRKENQRLEANLFNIIRREEERRRRAAIAAREKIEREQRAVKEAAKKEKEAEVATKTEKPEPKPEPERIEPTGMSEEESTLASTFAATKGRLPWPVKSGFVSDHFGVKKNEDINVMEDNQGVDIQTNAGESVRSVYDGVVMGVENYGLVKGVVYVQHGNFYTVYSKLKSVNVRPGQKIKAREPIGVVATSKDGVSEINFQVWKDRSNLNPELWLAPR